MDSNGKQKSYITLAQSRVSGAHFRPVKVCSNGQVNSLSVHTPSSTIEAMAQTCRAYGRKYNIPVLFQKHLATLPIPEPVRSELEALVLAEVEEVLK